jgi:hypoxanthine phosphoribosyltransferase
MPDSREQILFSEGAIHCRVEEMAAAIAGAGTRPGIAVPILVGAFMFASDLLRALSREGLDLPTDFIWLRAYGAGETPGDVAVLQGPSEAVRGKHVLLIDGVLDSGATFTRAENLLRAAGASGIVSAVAVAKRHPERAFHADHTGFEAGRDFLYGYGMDRAGAGRGLPQIRILT